MVIEHLASLSEAESFDPFHPTLLAFWLYIGQRACMFLSRTVYSFNPTGYLVQLKCKEVWTSPVLHLSTVSTLVAKDN
jgi:hypothetical protein